jgi:hypothetical protein
VAKSNTLSTLSQAAVFSFIIQYKKDYGGVWQAMHKKQKLEYYITLSHKLGVYFFNINGNA